MDLLQVYYKCNGSTPDGRQTGTHLFRWHLSIAQGQFCGGADGWKIWGNRKWLPLPAVLKYEPTHWLDRHGLIPEACEASYTDSLLAQTPEFCLIIIAFEKII